jgi:aspartate aminotransferase
VTNALFEALMRHRARTGKVVHVLSDEPYANLVFGPKPPESLLSAYDALWVVRSHSKDLGLAGERIGYVVWGSALSSPSTLGALRNAARAMGFVNAPALMQRLLPEVFGSRVEVSEYERRVNVFCGTLANGGVPCVRPGGTFFVFPSSPISDDRAFAAELLEAGVLVVPGSGFGKSGFVRCSLTRPLAEIREAAGIYVTTFNKLKK